MAVNKYFDPNTNEQLYKVYVNMRSRKIPTLRVQKRRKGISSKAEALRVEKKYLKEVAQEIAHREGTSSIWRVVIKRWAQEVESGYFSNITEKTVRDTCSLLNNWTADWLEIPCEELNRGHGKDLIRRAFDKGLKRSSVQKIKSAVNQVFNFGIEEGIIKGVSVSPVSGVQLLKKKEDTMKEILSLDECQKLLSEAKSRKHPWYHIWALALNTGCRSGELYALRKESIDFDLGLIRVTNSWDFQGDKLVPTKKSYWRNVPISSDLKDLLEEILSENYDDTFLLPRFREWQKGQQAQILREFCGVIGIPSVRFHTLRACFATHLLSAGVDPTVVRLIGGWKDIKSFQIYIRLSGISERGATEHLQFLTSNKSKNCKGKVLDFKSISGDGV